MISVNSVYTGVQSMLNKENRGYLRPEEFNNFAEVALFDVLEKIKEDFKTSTTSIVHGKANRYSTKYVEEAMSTFYKPATLTISGNQYSKPVDFDFLDGMYFGDIEITPASTREEKLMQTISYMNPTDSSPVYIEYNDMYEVIASDVIDEVDIYYYRTPNAPRWTYETIGQDIVYDGSNPSKQDFELPQGFYNVLVVEILRYAGVSIRDEQLLKALVSDEAAQSLANYRDKLLTK